MKTLVTYYSETGSTEKLARAIYEAVEGEKAILPIGEVDDLEGYDFIFCGFPVHAHSVPVPVQKFIKGIPSGKKLALFSTHGALTGGEKATTAVEHAASMASNVKVLGTFTCRGEVHPQTREALSGQLEHQAWAQEAHSSHSHPDEHDLHDAREFAKRMMDKAIHG